MIRMRLRRIARRQLYNMRIRVVSPHGTHFNVTVHELYLITKYGFNGVLSEPFPEGTSIIIEIPPVPPNKSRAIKRNWDVE